MCTDLSIKESLFGASTVPGSESVPSTRIGGKQDAWPLSQYLAKWSAAAC